MFELNKTSSSGLLKLHAEIAEMLRERGITRSANNPTGDLAEYLFCKAFNWKQAANSVKGYDAVDNENIHYQIKGRRLHARNKSRQLSAIRNLPSKPFDYLAAVLFDHNFLVSRAILAPHRVVLENSTFVAHTNSHRFVLHDKIWALDEVRDVTEVLSKIDL